MNIQGKNIAVLGGGVVGKATIRYAIAQKAKITLFDSKKESDYLPEEKDFFEINSINVIYEASVFERLSDFDLIVSSPGIDPKREDIQSAVLIGIPLYTDVTLFLENWNGTGPVIGVTGSNGKSTIVTLFEEAFKAEGLPVLMGGNIGNSPLDWLLSDDIRKDSYIVLELSSYMLEYFTEDHVLDIAVIVSFSQNHLSRHGTLEEYARVKTLGIKEGKTKVFLGDTPEVNKYIKPNIIDEEGIKFITKDTPEVIFEDISHMTMLGKHNKINCAVVATVLNHYKLLTEKSKKALYDFPGLAHRIEMIGIDRGIRYIDDSKSTSPDATIKALEAASEQSDQDRRNIILIAGGVDKGVTYESWESLFKKYVKHIVLLPGPAIEGISKVAELCSITTVVTKNQTKDSMDEAVKLAQECAVQGDTILLSPGAASLNLWNGFEARGRDFVKAVKDNSADL